MKIYKLKKILIFIIFIYYGVIIYLELNYLPIHKIIINKKIKKEIINLNKYYNLCNKNYLINKKKFKLFKNPKISIITAVYNSEKYIVRFLNSIRNQIFNNIELIFIDDFSKDNSIKLIEKYQKEDERIILIKQKKNKGTLISRNIGALKSKGEYLIFPDPDDILPSNILKLCYQYAKRFNYELIRFLFYRTNKIRINKFFYSLNKIINQPELSSFIFYEFGQLKLHDFNICNKFIKKELFIRTLNNIDYYYLNQYMIYFEDGFINYALHRNAKSLYLLSNIGYYYIFNKGSATHNVNKKLELKCFSLYLKFILENSKNNQHENFMAFHILKNYLNNQKKNKEKFSLSIKILKNNTLYLNDSNI